MAMTIRRRHSDRCQPRCKRHWVRCQTASTRCRYYFPQPKSQQLLVSAEVRCYRGLARGGKTYRLMPWKSQGVFGRKRTPRRLNLHSRNVLKPIPDDSPYAASWWYRTEFPTPANHRHVAHHFDGINNRAQKTDTNATATRWTLRLPKKTPKNNSK